MLWDDVPGDDDVPRQFGRSIRLFDRALEASPPYLAGKGLR